MPQHALRHLFGHGFISHGVEMNSVSGLPFRMSFDQLKQIVCCRGIVLHDLSGERIAHFDTACLISESLKIVFLPHRRCRGPDQFCIARMLVDCQNRFGKSVTILFFRVTPAVQAIVEVNHGELVLLQKQLQIVVERRIRDTF